MFVMVPLAHNNILIGTATMEPDSDSDSDSSHDSGTDSELLTSAPKPAPKGKHVQLFQMKRKVGKGFYSVPVDGQ